MTQLDTEKDNNRRLGFSPGTDQELRWKHLQGEGGRGLKPTVPPKPQREKGQQP